MHEVIGVAVVYALPEEQRVFRVSVEAGTTVAAAIDSSGVLQRYPELRADALCVGIFGVRVPLTRVVADGDRIEIYRPLVADPKESRRRRAARRGAG